MRLNLATAAPPTSCDNPFRKRRFALCRNLIESVLAQHGACRVLDIGGLPDYWRIYGADLVSDARVSISLLNLCYLDDKYSSEFDWKFERLTGDARNLEGIADKSFDVAHSNSVIEHVGRWRDMCAMAAEVRRVARLHYVQTPYWGFPIEPHNRTPFFHWLPEQFRYRLVLRRDRGFWSRAASVDEAMRSVQSSYLLDRRQFAALFPTSSIHSEIVYGLTKSLVAVGGDRLEVDARSNTRRLRI
jgi:Methyltransferase domain